MRQYHTHACLISGQPTPNLTPLLDQSIAPKRVVMFVSQEMQAKANSLEAVIKGRGIQCQKITVDSPNDIYALQKLFLNFIDQDDQEDIAFNITGGTKPMAIAAQEIARMAGKDVFYVEIQTGNITFLSDPDKPAPTPFQLKNKLKLDTHLLAHGYKTINYDTATRKDFSYSDENNAFAQELIKDSSNLSDAVKQLNMAASKATSQKNLVLNIEYPNDKTDRLLDILHHHKFVLTKEGKTYFKDAEIRRYLNGEWLEHHAYAMIRHLGIQDIALNLEVESTNVKNELDIACLHNNQLHIIECKTNNMNKDNRAKANETMYKLDSLTSLGGITTKGLLLSYQTVDDYSKKRAQDLRIKIVDGTKLKQLDSELKNWLFPAPRG